MEIKRETTIQVAKLKTCTKCGVDKPLTDFHRDKKRKDGFVCRCKTCVSEYGKNYRDSSPEFKATKAAYDEDYRELNRESRLAKKKKRYCENRDSINAKNKQYYEANREQIADYYRQYREQHPHICRAVGHRRRARLRDAPGASYTTAQHIIWRWAMWGDKCWMCGTDAEATDHVIPLGDGGPHWPANLRPICTACNSRRPKRRQSDMKTTVLPGGH